MNKDLKNQVMEKIHEKKVFMYPKIYFIARVALVVFISILAFLLLAFSVSFIFFSLHESGEQFLLGFGVSGILTFFKLFPWILVIFTTLLFFLLEWIMRQFKFIYHLPILYIFLYTIIIMILASFLVNLTPLHPNFLKKAEVNELPIIGGIYESIHDSRQNEGILRGNITSIQDNTLTMSHNDNDKDADDGTWRVVLPLGFDISKLSVGEKIYVAGTINGNQIEAYGIHELSSSK